MSETRVLQRRSFPNIWKSGQTLVELILAVTLWSLVAVVLLGFFAQGIQLYRRAQATSRLHSAAYRILEHVAKDMEKMVPYEGKGNPFVGGKDRLVFVIPTETGLQKVAYGLADDEARQIHHVIVKKSNFPERVVARKDLQEDTKVQLIRQQEIFVPDGNEEFKKDATRLFLSPDVKEDSFSFSYAHRQGEQVIWQQEWKQEGLPMAVELHMILSSGQEELTIDKKFFIPTTFWDGS